MLIHNSQSLYEKYSSVYKDFFANYPLVISSPGGAILSGAFSHQSGGLGMHLKIPLRNYLGIRPSKTTDSVSIDHYGTFNVINQKFDKNVPMEEIADKIKLLSDSYKKQTGNNLGIELGILNEIPRRHGLNNPGANAANLATTLLLLTQEIDVKSLESFQQDSCLISDILKNKIRSTIKTLHSHWIGPNSSGFGALSCFTKSQSPVVYQSLHQPVIKTLYEIFDIPQTQQIPCDIIILGTSDRMGIDFRLHTYDKMEDIPDITGQEIERIESYGFLLKDIDCKKEYKKLISERYRQAIDASSCATIMLMGRYLQQPTNTNQAHLFNAIDNTYSSLDLIDKNFTRKSKAATCIRNFFYQQLPDIPFAMTASIANHIVLFVVKEHFRPYLPKLQRHLRTGTNFPLTYPYISWRDGFEDGGVKIEQSQAHGIASLYLPKGSLLLKRLPNSSISTKIQYLKSIDRHIGCDLIINCLEKEISIGKHTMTSKEIPSAMALIILMRTIMNDTNLIVDSSHLPDQSYFRDRNELQSKIVSPLKKAVWKYIHKTLRLQIKGSIVNFKVALSPSDISIALIDKS